ncbi:hypothetical protein Syun_002241 [Stephania yunnanensis]|uniref:Uncharacterized protein n=1 Tax=Stephania yunnanensis TaxID=152371 RepID=A0AAP0LFG1_9MAGN
MGPLKFKKIEYNGTLPALELNPHSWTKIGSAPEETYELTHATSDQPVDDEAMYYDVANERYGVYAEAVRDDHGRSGPISPPPPPPPLVAEGANKSR